MIQKWKLLSSTDISPSKWFPVENRVYELPNGSIVDDFTVTTVADVALIIAITKGKKVVLVRQYKPGVDEITIEFPAGRKEPSHTDMIETARAELEEETGIRAEKFEKFTELSGFPTKATERLYCFLTTDVEVNSTQHLDTNEQIEVLFYTPQELDDLIFSGKMIYGVNIAMWVLAKHKFPNLFH